MSEYIIVYIYTYKCVYVCVCMSTQVIMILRHMVVSRKAKTKQHAHMSSSLHEDYTELFACNRDLKFVSTVTKPLTME